MINAYNLRARSLPVYITIMPVIFAMAAILPRGLDLPLAGAAAVVFVSLSYLASQLGADFGKRLEKKLWAKWGGPPTTRFLRHDNQEFNLVTRQKIHQKLSNFDLRIPSTEEQKRDPGLADTHWQASAEFLIRMTRDKRCYPLVFQGLADLPIWLSAQPFGPEANRSSYFDCLLGRVWARGLANLGLSRSHCGSNCSFPPYARDTYHVDFLVDRKYRLSIRQSLCSLPS